MKETSWHCPFKNKKRSNHELFEADVSVVIVICYTKHLLDFRLVDLKKGRHLKQENPNQIFLRGGGFVIKDDSDNLNQKDEENKIWENILQYIFCEGKDIYVINCSPVF